MKDILREPTQEWVNAKKKEHGVIYRTVLSGEVYIYRPLKRSEYRELQGTIVPEMTSQGQIVPPEQSLKLEEEITKKCVLWPEDYATRDVPAGVPAILANYISDSSGFQIDESPTPL